MSKKAANLAVFFALTHAKKVQETSISPVTAIAFFHFPPYAWRRSSAAYPSPDARIIIIFNKKFPERKTC
jgi:hypothetical protein